MIRRSLALAWLRVALWAALAAVPALLPLHGPAPAAADEKPISP